MASLKRSEARGGKTSANRALPLTYEDLKRCTEWMDHELAKMQMNGEGITIAQIKLRFMRAYLPLCWVLMARTDEIFKLKRKDIDLDVEHPLAHGEQYKFVKVWLSFRKTNQDRADAVAYELHPVPDEPAADVRGPLRDWTILISRLCHHNENLV